MEGKSGISRYLVRFSGTNPPRSAFEEDVAKGEFRRWVAPLALRSLLPVGTPRAHAIFRPVTALMIVLATLVASPQVGATGGGLSVASHIPEAAEDAGRPVTVIDRTDIELSGLRNLWDLSEGRLHYNSFGFYRPLVLGGGRLAFLVNGRHFSDSEIDLDAIPISAVESIEILSDSASALHGGNAIGGAVNIVLKRDYEGAEVQVGADYPTGAGGDTEHLSALWGGAIGRGHLTIGVDVFRRQEVLYADRDYSRASWTPGGPFAETSGVSVGGNTVFVRTIGGFIARSIGDCSGSGYTGVLTNPYNIPGMGCGFAYAEIMWAWERRNRESLFLNFDYPLGEDTDLYFDVRLTRSDAAYRYAPSVGTFAFVPSEGLRGQLLEDPEIDTVPPWLFAAHRFVSHGNRDFLEDHEEYDLTLGVEGQFAGGIGYDAYLRYYLHDVDETGGTFVSESAVQGAILLGRYDIENPFSMAPEHLAAIRETGLQLAGDRDEYHTTAHVSFDGTAFALGGGDARWAAGAEFAYEDWLHDHDYLSVFERSHEAGDVLGTAGVNAAGERRHWSAFSELSLPLHSNLEVDLLGRHDEYSDVGSAFVHQVASRYRLHEAVTVRGSWSGGARAPSLTALHADEAIGYPYICDPSTLTAGSEDCDEYQVLRVSRGNPNLEPDDAESLSLGAVTGLGPLSLSADWFWIRLSRVPAALSAQSAVDLEAEGRLPPGVNIMRDGDLITRIEGAWVNSGEADVAGVDLHASTDWETRWADMTFDTRWSHVTRHERRVAGEVQPGDFPRNRVHASLRAGRGSVMASWNVNAVSGYQNTLRTARYRPWMGHDVTLRWRDAFGLSGVDLTGGILNVADRGPSIDPTAPGAEGAVETWDSIRGRTVFLSLKVSFNP